MNKEELFVFVANNRPKMAAPFSIGDYSFATNGHIAVRVSRLADVDESVDDLNIRVSLLFENSIEPGMESALIEIPDFTITKQPPCKVCQGTGKTITCPECGGDGEILFSNYYSEYEFDCQTCGGDGVIPGENDRCSACNGTGKKIVMERIPVGCSGFSHHYLTMIKNLPGAKIAPTGPETIAYFKWDEGDGLLMPMRN